MVVRGVRPVRAALLVATGAVGMWALLRFGLLAWLPDNDHPVRPVVEGLSWMSAILALPLAVLAFRHQLRSQKRSVVTGLPSVANEKQSAGERGVIINDGVHGHGSGNTIGAITGGEVGIGQVSPDPHRPARP